MSECVYGFCWTFLRNIRLGSYGAERDGGGGGGGGGGALQEGFRHGAAATMSFMSSFRIIRIGVGCNSSEPLDYIAFA